MNILILNGNTTQEVTDRMCGLLAPRCPPDVQLTALTAPFGEAYVASRAAAAIAGHAALSALREAQKEGTPIAGCFYACFGEPGIEALRSEAHFPVVGMAEGAVHTALQMGGRFAILTVGAAWPGMLRDVLRQRGLDPRCAGIEIVQGNALALAHDRAAPTAALLDAARRAAASAPDVLIVAGAALAGAAADLSPHVDVPVIDSLFAGFEQTLALARLMST